MNTLDIEEVVAWMEARWGPDKAWGSWPDFYDDFASFTAGAMRETLYQWFKAGHRFGPKPSELVHAVSQTQARRVDRGEDEVERSCHGKHVWAEPAPYDEDRHQVCVLCGETGIVVQCEHQFQNGRCVYCPEGSNAA